MYLAIVLFLNSMVCFNRLFKKLKFTNETISFSIVVNFRNDFQQ